jgi:Fe-S-cluster-containing dehydrogenase component/DMSO reductase anchor subunit
VETPSLLELLLAQQQCTAVERFAQEHERGELPAHARHYSRLLPAAPPVPGQQYGFEVDLDRCSVCKACVTACHSLNGLDDGETWRNVGLLVGGTSAKAVMQHVTAACHHCLEPACLTACPVNAYEKDPLTGIVRHLDDQCFGCQYCTLACPYEVPRYHRAKGIVRKCDMCSPRLAIGEAPACVQACPQEAISIRVVDVLQVRDDAEADPFLPAAPEPHLTYPTTSYKTRRVFPRNLLPADYHSVAPQHPHGPLIVMLVLTQLSVGAFVVGLALEHISQAELLAPLRPVHALTALLFGLLALAASILHLGRPQYAYRAVLGLRHSWLSREIVAFGAFAGAAMVYAASTHLAPHAVELQTIMSWLVTLTGLAGVFCSAMIYAATRRELWSLPRAGLKFLLTSAVLGLAVFWLSLALAALVKNDLALGESVWRLGPVLCRAIIAGMTMKLLFDAAILRHLAGRRLTSLKRSARLMLGPLANVTLARFACGLLGGVAMPLFLLDMAASAEAQAAPVSALEAVAIATLFVACLAGELLERYLFFAACAAPRMPGGLRP